MDWNHMNGWGWTMMMFWSLIWIGFLGVVVWVAIQWTRDGSARVAPAPPPIKTARELLDERFARGDIDPDEYQQRRQVLEQRPIAGV